MRIVLWGFGVVIFNLDWSLNYCDIKLVGQAKEKKEEMISQPVVNIVWDR